MLAACRHIDTAQKIIRIEQSKGRKDRYVKLPDDKDYRLDGSARYKTMTLATDEFMIAFATTGCLPNPTVPPTSRERAPRDAWGRRDCESRLSRGFE